METEPEEQKTEEQNPEEPNETQRKCSQCLISQSTKYFYKHFKKCRKCQCITRLNSTTYKNKKKIKIPKKKKSKKPRGMNIYDSELQKAILVDIHLKNENGKYKYTLTEVGFKFNIKVSRLVYMKLRPSTSREVKLGGKRGNPHNDNPPKERISIPKKRGIFKIEESLRNAILDDVLLRNDDGEYVNTLQSVATKHNVKVAKLIYMNLRPKKLRPKIILE
jgi:hypothetical protein